MRTKCHAVFILSVDLQNQALQILRLGNRENHRVVWRCSPALQQPNPALRISRSGGHHADVAALMAQVNETLERWIRDRPGEWFWVHRRWPD